MECKQSHYFFINLGEDSWGILTVIPCERMTKGNCISAKVMPDHNMIRFNPEMINLHRKILLVIKPMRTQFKFTLRLICTPEYKYTQEYIYTRVFFAHANWTLVLVDTQCYREVNASLSQDTVRIRADHKK